MSPSNYPPTDPDYSVPQVRYEHKSIDVYKRQLMPEIEILKHIIENKNLLLMVEYLMIWKSMLIEGVETISAIRSLQSLHRSKGQKK